MTKQIDTKSNVKRFRLSELEMADYNPRSITDEASAGLAESIGKLGLLELPIVNVKDGKKRVVGGHQRVRALLAQKFTEADCIVVRFDEAAEMSANIALNNTATQGMYDPVTLPASLDRLKERLPSPNFGRFDTEATRLREQAARQRVSSAKKASDETPDAEAETDSKLGRMYALGEHRLYCGDFRDGCERLFPKMYAHAVITDPPYNVAYTGGKHWRKDELREAIEGDDQDADQWEPFVNDLATTLLQSCDGPIYVFFAAKEMHVLQTAWEVSDGVVHRWLVIGKDAHTLSPADYHPQYELCLFGSRRDAKLREHAKAKTNVISIPRPSQNKLHPTQKSVDLIRQLMEDATDVQEIVLDPFGGSGTTLAVAQEMQRICYTCEIDPANCDVIRKRWAENVEGQGCDWRALTPVLKKGSK